MRIKSGSKYLVFQRYGISIEFHRPKVGGGTYARDSLHWRYPWLPEATKREIRIRKVESADNDAFWKSIIS